MLFGRGLFVVKEVGREEAPKPKFVAREVGWLHGVGLAKKAGTEEQLACSGDFGEHQSQHGVVPVARKFAYLFECVNAGRGLGAGLLEFLIHDFLRDLRRGIDPHTLIELLEIGQAAPLHFAGLPARKPTLPEVA